MAVITAEGKLWIGLEDLYGWLEACGYKVNNLINVHFGVEDDALVLIRQGMEDIQVDAAELWKWVIESQLPAGISAFEMVFGVPKVEGPDLVISYAASSEGDPRNWATPPACLAEWKGQ